MKSWENAFNLFRIRWLVWIIFRVRYFLLHISLPFILNLFMCLPQWHLHSLLSSKLQRGLNGFTHKNCCMINIRIFLLYLIHTFPFSSFSFQNFHFKDSNLSMECCAVSKNCQKIKKNEQKLWKLGYFIVHASVWK